MLIPSLMFLKKVIKGQNSPQNTIYVCSLFTDYQSRVRPGWLKVPIPSNNPNNLTTEYQQVCMTSLHQEKGRETFQCF